MKRAARHRGWHGTSVLLLTMLLLLVAGCGPEVQGSGDDASAAISVDVPPIYVAQTLVMKEAGKPMVERSYRQLLKACHEGAMATTPLSDSDAKRIGRTYYQLWFDTEHSAWQKDIWDFGAGDDLDKICQFHVKHESYKGIYSAGANYGVDLIAKTATTEPSSGFTPGGHEGLDDDDQLDASAKSLGFQRLGYATDAGQRCLRWRMPKPDDVESCTWSEGRKWGFGRGDGSTQGGGAYDTDFIVLWVHPANGTGEELTTQKMTVGGEPFDDALFAPPHGVTIKKGRP